MPLGVWLGHIGRYQFLATSISNIGRAVPALGLIVFFIAFLGVGFLNVCVALVLLAIPPIITNSYVGIRGVDPETVDAARGNGLTGRQIALQVELPMALPTIMGGIRISLVSVIATATIAPLANVDTLGRPIISPNVYGTAGQLAACIVVALVTFGADGAFVALQRAVTPEGLKLAERGRPGWPAPRLPVIEEEHADIVRRTHPLLALLAVLCLGFVFAACGGDDEEPSSSSSSGSKSSEAPGNEIQKVAGAESKPAITVGSKNFTEQFVLGEIYSQALEAAGFKVKKQLDLGSELIAHKALQAGKIDAYPEYTGTALTSFFKVKTADVPRDANTAYEDTKAAFAKEDITALAPDAVREHLPPRHDQGGRPKKLGNPKTISDLKGKESDLSIAGFPECKQRQDCLLGVEDTYGLKFGKFVTSEQPVPGARLRRRGRRVHLHDRRRAGRRQVRGAGRRQEVLPALQRHVQRSATRRSKNLGPEGQKVIEDVQKPLTEKVMQELNARVDIDKQKPAEVAKSYLQQAGFVK